MKDSSPFDTPDPSRGERRGEEGEGGVKGMAEKNGKRGGEGAVKYIVER